MKRSTIASAVFALALSMGSVLAFAQGRGGGRAPGGPPSSPGGTHGPSGTPGSEHPGSESTTDKKTVSDLLTRNTKLASKISDLTGMDAQKACSGFKNLGQCVAAAHVAHNLGGSCTFSNLKTATTGSQSESLGQAIHECNPHVDSKAEAKKGEKQAHDDLKETGS